MAEPFERTQGELYVEELPLTGIAAEYGTPCYVYSRSAIETAVKTLDASLSPYPHQICYAVKANSNLAVLNLMARLGAGFDVVSGGELARVIAAGGNPAQVVFSGVAKTDDELHQALAAGVSCINIESISEIVRLEKIAAELGLIAPVALRVNPDVDAKTHPYISTGLKENKFGVEIAAAEAIYSQLDSSPHLSPIGIDCHIGSQLTDLAPLSDAVTRVLGLVDQLHSLGIHLHHIDIGGGLGIRYKDEEAPSLKEYAELLLALFKGRTEQLVVEPGRSLVGNAGVLLTRVIGLKPGAEKNFALVDAAMNDLLRPALYGAWHNIENLEEPSSVPPRKWDIVGPICETGDFIGQQRLLALQEGDLLAIMSCGAYGFTMASNYNSRPRAAEVMVDGGRHHLVRQRETIEQLFDRESLFPDVE
ncbi:MAG: diaminopimelate decarboxylase [Gammaproteobacteria bacterium]|nr:MAG: diaminopimelate decarboxylase [Gammaproteobacteria bacterium]RLA15119.1 MAG: diaminopimelate decarboxylase [Gammaproteobacteria bacterium]RLA17782.1 MAG: diaminopimelate decarboxylase [Gammaproteobacteria bacterium]